MSFCYFSFMLLLLGMGNFEILFCVCVLVDTTLRQETVCIWLGRRTGTNTHVIWRHRLGLTVHCQNSPDDSRNAPALLLDPHEGSKSCCHCHKINI